MRGCNCVEEDGNRKGLSVHCKLKLLGYTVDSCLHRPYHDTLAQKAKALDPERTQNMHDVEASIWWEYLMLLDRA